MRLLGPRKSRSTTSVRRRPGFRPRLEALEDRYVPSGGALDPTFGTGGLVSTAIGSRNDNPGAVITQADGKIVAGGYSTNSNGVEEFTLVRYNTNGSLDTSFGQNGIVQTAVGKSHSWINALALESINGVEKIVAVGKGYSSGKPANAWAVARYNLDGTLDTAFNRTGIVLVNSGGGTGGNEEAYAVAIDGNGKIDVVGASMPGSLRDFTLMRFNANGSLDTTLGKNGIVTTQIGNIASFAQALAIQPNGEIVVAGLSYDGSEDAMAAVRYTARGLLDSSFGTNGIVAGLIPANGASAGAGNVLVLGSGEIILGGFSHNTVLTLAGLTSTGQLDTSFGSSGFAFDTALGAGGSLGLGSNGDLMVAGITSVPHDSSGNVVQYQEPAVAAFLPGGALDTSFGTNGIAIADFGNIEVGASALTVQSDGKIVVAGGEADGFYLARFLPSAPQISSFTAMPNPVTSGSNLTLTASNITDSNPNSTITQVTFYYFDNSGNKVTLGTATQSSGGAWSVSVAITLPAGSYTIDAQAEDNYYVFGDPFAITLNVQ
jgi:uncharacterized delta-60 repeat protein